MRKLCLLFPLTVLIAGCSTVYTESPEAASSNGGLVFSASFAPEVETKTVMDENQENVLFSGDESIVVFDSIEDGYKYTNTKSSGGSTAVFDANDDVSALVEPDPDDPDDLWYALYPYNEDVVLSEGVFTTTLKDAYTLEGSNTFSDEMNISVAKSNTTDFSFKNVLSWLRVAYKGMEDVQRIELRGNDGEDLAGKLSIDYTGEVPVTTIVEGTGKKVMTVYLNSPEECESEPKNERVYFYIPVLPGTYDKGLTLTFVSEDGVTRTHVIDVSVTFNRSKKRATYANLTVNLYKRVESLSEINQITDAKCLLVYPSGSEYRAFSFQKTMENIVAEADRLEDVHTLDELKNQATTIYQNALKANYTVASSTDGGVTISFDNEEDEENSVFAVTGSYTNAETTLSADVDGKAFSLKLENITAELKDNYAAVISAVPNGENLVTMATTLRGHQITLTIGNCIDYVGAKFGLNPSQLLMAKGLFVDLCALVGEYTGKPFSVDLNTTVANFYNQYWDNIRDYAMVFGGDKKWGSFYPVGFYKADNGFTFNVPVPNKVWFEYFEESTSQDIDYFVEYWSKMNGYHNFPFGVVAQRFASKLSEESFEVIKSINFASIGATYQRYVDRFNDTLEEVYIYKLVE